jgi:hypothetical protein
VGEETRFMTLNDAETRLRLLYEETGRVAAVFFEWRHKVILLCSAVLTLALAAVSWMYNARLGGIAMAIPLLFGSFVAAACRRFDRRNGQILDDCFKAGQDFEERFATLGAGPPLPEGIYTRILRTRGQRKLYEPPAHTYSWTLRRGYATISGLLFALAATLLLLGLTTPHFLLPPGRG